MIKLPTIQAEKFEALLKAATTQGRGAFGFGRTTFNALYKRLLLSPEPLTAGELIEEIDLPVVGWEDAVRFFSIALPLGLIDVSYTIPKTLGHIYPGQFQIISLTHSGRKYYQAITGDLEAPTRLQDVYDILLKMPFIEHFSNGVYAVVVDNFNAPKGNVTTVKIDFSKCGSQEDIYKTLFSGVYNSGSKIKSNFITEVMGISPEDAETIKADLLCDGIRPEELGGEHNRNFCSYCIEHGRTINGEKCVGNCLSEVSNTIFNPYSLTQFDLDTKLSQIGKDAKIRRESVVKEFYDLCNKKIGYKSEVEFFFALNEKLTTGKYPDVSSNTNNFNPYSLTEPVLQGLLIDIAKRTNQSYKIVCGMFEILNREENYPTKDEFFTKLERWIVNGSKKKT